jgi:hypothetical protein
VLTSVRATFRRQLAGAGLAVVVVTLYVRVEVGLRRHALPEVCQRLGVGLGDALPDLAGTAVPSRDWLARRVRAVHRVGRHWPYGDTCLRRCLVLGSLLRRTGPVLVLGVRRGAGSSVEAHSWLEIDGRPVDPTSPSYVVLARRGHP